MLNRGASMFEIAKRYSEQTYYRKVDIGKEMEYHIVAPIWEEIKKYRAIFRKDYPLFQCYLVHNPNMMHTLMKVQHTLTQYVVQAKRRNHKDTIPKQLYPLYSAYMDRVYKLDNDTVWFMNCVRVLTLPIKEELLYFLCDEEIPMLIRLFFLRDRCEDTLLLLFLIKESCTPIFSLLANIETSIEKDDQDGTFSFLHFLHKVWLQVSTEMNATKIDKDMDMRNKNIEELKEMYPILSDHQLRFYVDHRQAQRYYTITQYMEYAHVCYETARYSMERFVHLHWYQKEKVGKKFIYKVF